MADLKPIQWHTDEERFEENGHKGRFILPRTRMGGCSTRFLAGRAPLRDFSVKFGNCSGNEARQYAGRLQDAPQRAMAVYEGDGGDKRRYDVPLFAKTMLNLLPDAAGSDPITQPGWPWWEVLMQWNAGPLLPGGRWRSPPAALGRKRTAAGEFLVVELRRDPPDPQAQGVPIEGIPLIPIQRRQHQVEMRFKDGRGGDGSFWLKLNDKVVCDYRGPLGYADYSPPYFAYGVYRSPNSLGMTTVRYEGLIEGLAA